MRKNSEVIDTNNHNAGIEIVRIRKNYAREEVLKGGYSFRSPALIPGPHGNQRVLAMVHEVRCVPAYHRIGIHHCDARIWTEFRDDRGRRKPPLDRGRRIRKGINALCVFHKGELDPMCLAPPLPSGASRSEEHTSELQ